MFLLRSSLSQMFLEIRNWIGALRNFVNFTGTTCVRVSFFNVTGFHSCNFIKKIPQHRCFPVKFEKFLRTPFLQNTSGGCACHFFTPEYVFRGFRNWTLAWNGWMIPVNPLSTNPTEWSDTLRTNFLSVFDHLVGLTLKGLK